MSAKAAFPNSLWHCIGLVRADPRPAQSCSGPVRGSGGDVAAPVLLLLLGLCWEKAAGGGELLLSLPAF